MSERPKNESSRRAPVINPELPQLETNKPLSHVNQETLKETYREKERKMKNLTEEEQLKAERLEAIRENIARSQGDEKSKRRFKKLQSEGYVREGSRKDKVSKAPKLPKNEAA